MAKENAILEALMHIGAHLPGHVHGEVEQVLFDGLGGEGVFEAFVARARQGDGGEERSIFDAVKQGDVEHVKHLLDEDGDLLDARSEDPTFKTDYRATPLVLAAKWGQLEVAKLLVSRGANVNASNGCSYTALQHAARHGHGELVAFLLSNGADARVRDSVGATPLINAANQGHLPVVNLFIQALDSSAINDVDVDHTSALHKASQRGHVAVVKALLLASCDPSLRSGTGLTPLQVATARQQHDVLALFQWWEGELERASVLSKARHLLQQPAASLAQCSASSSSSSSSPVSPVEPALLPTGGAAAQQQEQQEGEEEKTRAVLHFVLHDLASDLFTELMAGFHKKAPPSQQSFRGFGGRRGAMVW